MNLPRYSVDIHSNMAIPQGNLQWKEPWAWKDGQVHLFTSYKAHVATHRVKNGWVYTVRICSLKIPKEGI